MKVFVGYDAREDIAYRVCEYSIKKHQPNAEVIPLRQKDLRKLGLYWREKDPLASTDFSLTRFLVPALMNYQGWAVFVDCDFLWTDNIQKLFDLRDESKAVMVVKHDYTPAEGIKMDGCKQLPYPRKNWSSMILWNCGHPSNKYIVPEAVNAETPQFLHRFQWIRDHYIGEIGKEWNWLVNWYKEPQDGKPIAIHYTEGGPWFENYEHTEYGLIWERYKNEYESKLKKTSAYAPEVESVVKNILEYRVDPAGLIYNLTEEKLLENIKNLKTNNVIGIIDEERIMNKRPDPILENFITGCGGQLTTAEDLDSSNTPIAIRGLGRSKIIKECVLTNRDFYFIDTGYFGNQKKKLYHRVTKNNLQQLGPIIDRPRDRIKLLGIAPQPFTKGNSILLCPPSEKVMKHFGLDLQQWILETTEEIKKYTDKPIVVREKKSRRERVVGDTIQDALSRDVHCLVTFNSIAAVEAILFGKPAITLGPNAASVLCSNSISDIEKPHIPTNEEIMKWAAHLSYCQFTPDEMINGYAWNVLTNKL